MKNKNKLLESFLDLKCPFHGCNLKKVVGGILVCDENSYCSWYPARVENILNFQAAGDSIVRKKLSYLKEYFSEQ